MHWQLRLTIYSTMLPVSAQLESNQKKDATCMDDRLHTRNFCDGYFIGNGDCENNNAVGQGILIPTQRIGEEVISRAILMVDVRPPNWG